MVPVRQDNSTDYTKFNTSSVPVGKKSPQIEDNVSNEKVSRLATASQAFAPNNPYATTQPAGKIPQFPEEYVISPIIFNKQPSDASHSNNRNELDSISSQFRETDLDQKEEKETNINLTDKVSQTVMNQSSFHIPSASKALEMNIKPKIPYSPLNQDDINLIENFRLITRASNGNDPSIWSERPSRNELNRFIDLVSAKYGIEFLPQNKALIFERFSLIELDRGKLAIMYNILNRYISTKEKIKYNNKPEEQVKLYYNIAAAAYWAYSYQEDSSYLLNDIALYFGAGYLSDIANYNKNIKLVSEYEAKIHNIEYIIKNADPKQTDLIKNYEISIEIYKSYLNEIKTKLSNIKPLIVTLRNHFDFMFDYLEGKAVDFRDQHSVKNLNEVTQSVLRDYENEIYFPANNLASQINPL